MNVVQETIYVEDAIKMVDFSYEKQGTSESTKRLYKSIFRNLASFSHSNFDGEYTPDIGEIFLRVNEKRVPVFLVQSTFNSYVNAVLRLNHVIEGNFDWHPTNKKAQDYAKSKFDKIVKGYTEYLRNSSKAKSDQRARIHVVARFLQSIDQQGMSCLNEMTPQHIYCAFESATDKGGFRKLVCSFLQYAYRYELISVDFSLIVPSVVRHTPVPSIYSLDEIDTLLNSVDRATHIGKRNYAIILMAARLGLRSCDIVSLKLEDVNFENDIISIVQEKTGEPQTLPLLPEIKEALNDYIYNARPKSESDNIFLKAVQPLGQPIPSASVYSIFSNQFNRAGILPKGRRQGSHALRASLATSLLDEGVEYSVIGKVLGHTSKTATKSYVKIDISHLRPFALTVPKPSGMFGKNLDKRGGAQ